MAFRFTLLAASAAVACISGPAAAQAVPTAGPGSGLAAAQAQPVVSAAAAAPAAAQLITITGSSAAHSAGVAGFGNVPLSRAPFSATVISTQQMLDAGVASLADITRLDAGITDAYNAPGYWGQVAVRGFTLDNRFNFRRDGLPVNAETVLPTANKAALELLKGASGIQAGTSAPGGLLNLVVKRPTARALSEASLEWVQPGTLAVAADVSRRVGADDAGGWRLNAQATRLDPQTRSSRGESHLLAAAAEWKLPGDALIEVEAEGNRQSQPSTPGFSLLGTRLPDAKSIDPRLNLNNQRWSLPVVFEGRTGSLRYTQPVGLDTQFTAQLMQQRLHTDDRIAFPFGCSAEDRYDRYCSDGSFDLYDFRSEGERRTTRAADLSLQGRHTLAGLRHRWTLGVLATRHEARFNRQAYNHVGPGFIDGSAVLAADPTLTDENTNRDERSTEWRLQDAVTLNPQWQLWLGLRHTAIERRSVRTDGSRATAYTQRMSTPWAALSWQLQPALMAYASWGQGMESEVAPNRARYTNAGQALPTLKSRQLEAGLKHRSNRVQWQLAFFEVDRPQWSDIDVATGLPSDSCSDQARCLRREDGSARHRGLEAEAEWQLGAWSLRGSLLALQARRVGAAAAATNGRQPTNVPERSLKLQAAYNVAAAPGLALLAWATHEGPRAVLPDNTAFTPGWTRVDLGLRWAQTWGGARWVWRAGLDNVADQRAWKESPYQFGHAYLYPLAPRTWRVALNVTL
jgi:iron complex outermembrane receptor protein